MKIDLKQLEILYFQNDLEVPYVLKDKTELLIHPIKVKDWSIFESCEAILKINKNRFDSVEILRMSYLNFLVEHVLEDKDNMNKTRLILVSSSLLLSLLLQTSLFYKPSIDKKMQRSCASLFAHRKYRQVYFINQIKS